MRLLDHRAEAGLGLQRVADRPRLEALDEVLDQVVANRAVDQQSRSGRAVLAHVHEPREEDLLGDAVQLGRIGEHDLRALAAHLERDFLEVALRGVVQELAAGLRRTGERHHVDVHVPPECLAGVGSRPRHDVEDAVRQPGLRRDLGHPKRRHRRQPGGLDDQAVAGREGRGGLPGRHQQGEVPGDHRPHHADRLADDQAEGVRTGRRDGVEDLVDRLREPAVGPDGIRDVDLAGVGDRLAALERVEERELLEVRLEQVGEAEEDLLALGRGAPRPAPVVECPARRPDRGIDVGRAARRDRRDRPARGRVLGHERLARRGVLELPVDECLRAEGRKCRDRHRNRLLPLGPLGPRSIAQRRLGRKRRSRVLPQSGKNTGTRKTPTTKNSTITTLPSFQ